MTFIVERTQITRDILASAIRHLRISGRLTQKCISKRAALFEDLGFGKLLESQISDFERGRTLPSLGSLLNLLAGCSEDGSHVDFGVFQRALEIVVDHEGMEAHNHKDPRVNQQDLVDRIVEGLSARWAEPLQGAISHQGDELAKLRVRLAQTEQLMASLLNDDGHVGSHVESHVESHVGDRIRDHDEDHSPPV